MIAWHRWRERYLEAQSQIRDGFTRIRELEADLADANHRIEALGRQIVAERERATRWSDAHEQVRGELRLALERAYELSRAMLEAFVSLRRDGFNPTPAAVEAVNRVAPAAEPLAGEDRELTPAQLEVAWGLCLEAAQERGGGNPELLNAIIGQAHTWRRAGVSLREIERRIYAGTGD